MNGQNCGLLTKNSLNFMTLVQFPLGFFDAYVYLFWANNDAYNYTDDVNGILLFNIFLMHFLIGTIMLFVSWNIEAIYDIGKPITPCVYHLSTNLLYLTLIIMCGIVSTIVSAILFVREIKDTQFMITLSTLELVNTIVTYILIILTLLRIRKSIYVDKRDSVLDEV